MRDDPLRVSQQLDFLGVERQIGRAKLLADHQSAHIHLELVRNLAGQAFDFDFAGHHFEDATLHLDALRLAESVDRHLDAHAHVHSDSQHIHVQQRALRRVHLPVFQDGLVFAAVQLDGKDGVVAGFGAQNAGHLFGVNRHGLRLA